MNKVTVLNTKPYVMNIKDVNRVYFHVFFPIKRDKKDRGNLLLNRRMLQNSCKYFNNATLNKVLDENYIIDYNVFLQSSVNYDLINFSLQIPKLGLIDEFDLNKVLKIFHDMIFEPFVTDDQFDEDFFNREKYYLIRKEDNFPNGLEDYSHEAYLHFTDPEEKHDIFEESYLKLLNEVNPKGAYNYYLNNIKNGTYYSIISGATDDTIVNTFSELFKQEEKETTYEIQFEDIDEVSEYEKKIDKTKYNQTKMYLHYNVKDYESSKDEVLFDQLYYFLHARENDLIFKKLRVDNNLIYQCTCSKRNSYAVYVIVVYLDKNDIDKAKELIKEVFNEILDESYYNECRERLLKALRYDLLDEEDDPFNDVSDFFNSLVGAGFNMKKRIELTEKIKFDEFKEFVNRVILTKELIIEGGDTNE